MTTYELSKEDYEDLREILNLERENFELFLELGKNEYKENLREYNIILDKIDFISNKIDTYLDTLSEDVAILYSLKDVLELKNELEFYGEFNPKINENYSIRIRLIRKIENMLINAYKNDSEYIEYEDESEDEEEKIDVYTLDLDSGLVTDADIEFNDDICGSSLLELSVLNDVVRNYLTILDEYINSDKYLSIKQELLQYKYYLLFRNPDIEKEFRKNGFEVSKFLYESTPMLLSKYDLEIDYNYLCDTFGLELLTYAQDNLLESFIVDNLDLYNEVINAIAIRIGSLFVDNENYGSLKEDINRLDIIDSPIIKESLSSLTKDYNNIVILKLGFNSRNLD